MTGETLRELLKPLIGKSGSISVVVSEIGHVGFAATENKRLTGVEVRADGLVRLERESGWAVIDPGPVVAVVWDGEPVTSAGQFL
jgi:hypothetical protein